MGKAEVREQLYDFLERGTEYAYEELRPVSTVGPGFLPGNRLAKLLLRPVIDDNVKEIEMGLKNELTLVMDYAEEKARGDGADPSKYTGKFLESDIFFRHYEGERQDELEEALVRHFEEMARDMTPLIRADADGFWGATREAYDKYEAEEILRHHFSFVGMVAEEFGDGLVMETSFGPVGVDYTKEALRILPKVETRIRREVVDEVDEAYGSRYGDARSRSTGLSSVVSEAPHEEDAGGRVETDGEPQALRDRLEEMEEENEDLRRRLREERERNEELKEKLEEKRESYSAEDWLG